MRNELHFLSGHKNDVLSRDLQPQIAKNFGYDADEHSLGVESFMRDYYLHARVIHRCPAGSSRAAGDAVAPGTVRGGCGRRRWPTGSSSSTSSCTSPSRTGAPSGGAAAAHQGVLARHQLGFELGIDVERAIEESLDLVDDAFRASAEARDLFLGICRAGAGSPRPSARCTSWGCSAGTCPSGTR